MKRQLTSKPPAGPIDELGARCHRTFFDLVSEFTLAGDQIFGQPAQWKRRAVPSKCIETGAARLSVAGAPLRATERASSGSKTDLATPPPWSPTLVGNGVTRRAPVGCRALLRYAATSGPYARRLVWTAGCAGLLTQRPAPNMEDIINSSAHRCCRASASSDIELQLNYPNF